jgi:tetratricopeptide (TPR) repeat protein
VQAGAAENAKQSFLRESESHPECLLAHIGMAQVAFLNDQVPSALEQLHFVRDRDPNFLDHNLQRVWTGLDQDHIKKLVSEIEKDSGVDDGLTSRLRQSVDPTYHPGASSITAQERTPSAPGQAVTLNPEKLWAEGRYGACASEVARPPRTASAALLRLLEVCSFYASQYRRTLETSDHILENGENADALYWKAKAAQELGADAFAQMNAVAPDSAKAHLLMAELHRVRQEFPAAESEYNRVLASDSDDLSARLGLAHVYFQSLEDDEAAEQARDVLKADSSNVEAHSLLGQILVRQHQYDDAIPHLKIALQGSSVEAPTIHSSLAQCYLVRGEYSLALRELKLALPADSTGAFHYQAYKLYQKMGDQQSAAAALRESEEIRRRESDAEQQRMLTTGSDR